MLKKIVTGGQTGVDRAALDAAIGWNFDYGGYIPDGRKAEDGQIHEIYENLTELKGKGYEDRTEQNVIHSDGTLIIYSENLAGGTELTFDKARHHNRPHLCIDISTTSVCDAACIARGWVQTNDIEVLNVAGPRHSENCKVYGYTLALLNKVLSSGQASDVDVDLAIHAAEESMLRFRHWDLIRWSIPAWFIAILALFSAAAKDFASNLTCEVQIVALYCLAMFGLFCLVLEFNLVKYHNDEIYNLRKTLKSICISKEAINVLLPKLPFDYKIYIWKTATFYAVIMITVLTLTTLFVATSMWINYEWTIKLLIR